MTLYLSNFHPFPIRKDNRSLRRPTRPPRLLYAELVTEDEALISVV
jgi:hypothetical protein